MDVGKDLCTHSFLYVLQPIPIHFIVFYYFICESRTLDQTIPADASETYREDIEIIRKGLEQIQ